MNLNRDNQIKKKQGKGEKPNSFAFLCLCLVCCLSLINLSACQNKPDSQQKETNSATPAAENQLSLKDATLEQSNSKGQKLWKIIVEETVYSQDRQQAELKNIRGEIFQDNEVILKVTASRGEISNNGERIFLTENLIASDPSNGSTLTADELEWYTKEDIVELRGNLRGNHPQLIISANQGKYYLKPKRLELSGNVILVSPEDKLQLKTENISWEMPTEVITSETPVEINRFLEKTITDQVLADNLKLELNTKQLFLKKNVSLKSLDPPLQIATESAIWNYQKRVLTVDQPLTIIHNQEQITITANQGKLDLEAEKGHLFGEVKAISLKKQAELTADDVIWYISTQTLEASENVVYQQQDPKLHLTGVKAVGKLQDNSVIVTGNEQNKVITEIIPPPENN